MIKDYFSQLKIKFNSTRLANKNKIKTLRLEKYSFFLTNKIILLELGNKNGKYWKNIFCLFICLVRKYLGFFLMFKIRLKQTI